MIKLKFAREKSSMFEQRNSINEYPRVILLIQQHPLELARGSPAFSNLKE